MIMKNLKFILIALCFLVVVDDALSEWFNHGCYITNRRDASGDLLLNPVTVRNLHLRWKFFAGRDISATPALADGVVYFPSWDGFLYAVNAFTGSLIWQQNVSQLTGLPPTGRYGNVSVSRATPTVAGNLLIVGIYGPAVVIAVTRTTGRLIWSRVLDSRPLIMITGSGSVHLGAFYVGISSMEEVLPEEQCCTFRGSLVKLDIQTGAILWQTYMLPDNGGRLGGFSGAAIWGSSPAIDVIRNHVYVATGNLYSVPLEVRQCRNKQCNQTKSTAPDQCFGLDVYSNTILAVDINTGRVRWSRRLGGYDIFYLACLDPNKKDCPSGPNLEADFGEAPMLIRIVGSYGRQRDVAVAVQKSGFVWALDRDNGEIVWFKVSFIYSFIEYLILRKIFKNCSWRGPGGKEGGGIWGAATDGRRVYTNIANSDKVNFQLTPSLKTTTSGAWVALDANSGEIVWSTANPSGDTCQGPVSLVNGLLFGGSVASNGPLYAMDASNGEILWMNFTGATIYGGVSASYGCIYLGNGYSRALPQSHPTWSAGTSLHAYCII